MGSPTSNLAAEAPSWSKRDVAAYLSISIRHLDDVRREDPTFPMPRMVGSLLRWDPRDIVEWVRRPAAATVTAPRRLTKGSSRRV